jgi:4-azaleucine resistance transporter AzlC
VTSQPVPDPPERDPVEPNPTSQEPVEPNPTAQDPAERGPTLPERALRDPTAPLTGRSVLTASLSLGAAVGLFGASFGVLSVANGLSVAQAATMSLLVFTGASQFAAVGVVATGGTGAAAVGSALLLAARNGVYGLAMALVLRGSLGRRLIAAQLVIDESTAMATAQPDRQAQERAFWLTGGAVFAFWNAGTLIGALSGGLIHDPAALGLDAAFPAGFVVLLGPHLRTTEGRQAAALAAVLVIVTTPFLRPGVPILVAALAATIGLRRQL